MGPHSFKCGSPHAHARARTHAHALQWGRTLSSAEVARCHLQGLGKAPRFNGAALFQVRKSRRQSPDAKAQTPLQWGRTLSSAEVHPLVCLSRRLVLLLQWGRTLSSAEVIFRIARRRVAAMASMGPHSFKCGSRIRASGMRIFAPGFNGAALFQVRKCW